MSSIIKIGTRESELAVWQATQVKNLLVSNGFTAELIYIKSEGDIDLQTPLYEMGVQGIFTRSLDIALLKGTIDIAVHSMKDVPTQLPGGIVQAAVLKRGNYKDLFVINEHFVSDNAYKSFFESLTSPGEAVFPSPHQRLTIATSSIRRKAQWLNRYPGHTLENLRGNVNTRLRKVAESQWQGAIFAAAGLERINLRPTTALELDWMLPAPAQGAVMVVCREADQKILEACALFNDEQTATCTKIERDFLRTLLGGCSTPISALTEVQDQKLHFRGNILSIDGKEKRSIERTIEAGNADHWGAELALELLKNGGQAISDGIRSR